MIEEREKKIKKTTTGKRIFSLSSTREGGVILLRFDSLNMPGRGGRRLV